MASIYRLPNHQDLVFKICRANNGTVALSLTVLRYMYIKVHVRSIDRCLRIAVGVATVLDLEAHPRFLTSMFLFFHSDT